MIQKFRKKPIVIEGVTYDGKNNIEILSFAGKDGVFMSGNHNLIIHTAEGDMRVSIGDTVLKGVNGEFYPIKPDILAKTYHVL